ncbi:uncharacterized protein LOC142000727 [Natator depressus]|uniref:uncharacterized protein LOC142000727 n=1 Tax=Natator depressus TaxID=27790 RepID=UPI003EB8C75A
MMDQQQCCVKAKELEQAYQKTREAKKQLGVKPQTCHFCNDLHAILGGELHPPTHHNTVNISKEPKSQVSAVNRKADGGGQGRGGGWGTGNWIQLDSKLGPVFYSTADQPVLPIESMGKSSAGEGTSAAAALRVFLSTPAECLTQIRRRKKRTWDDVFTELLQASAALDFEHRDCRMNIGDSLEKERVERRKVQEKEREMHQDIIRLLRQQTQILQTLVDPHV